MSDVQAGVELDRAIGEIVGDPFPRAHDWEHTGLSGYETSFYRCVRCGDFEADDCGDLPGYDPGDPCVVPYSTDLNAAFMAAERVFSEFRLRHLGYLDKERWEFECEFPGDDDWSYCGKYSTGALAICAGLILGRVKEARG